MSKILVAIASNSALSTSLNSLSVDSGYEKYVLIISAIIFAAIIIVVFGNDLCNSKDKNDEE